MKILRYILFVLLIILKVHPQDFDYYYNITVPKLVAANTQFDIALLTSNTIKPSDKFVLKFLSDKNLRLISANIFTSDTSADLKIKSEYSKDFSSAINFVDVDLKKYNITSASFFQVVLSVKSIQPGDQTIKLLGEFFNGKKLAAAICNPEVEKVEDPDAFLKYSLEIYKPQRFAGEALRFDNGAELNSDIKLSSEKDFVFGAWMKFLSPSGTFLKINENQTQKLLFTLNLNDYQKLSSVINTKQSKNYDSPFISENVWYYFEIKINAEANKILFLLDGKLIADGKWERSTGQNTLSLKIINNKDFPFEIDDFKLKLEKTVSNNVSGRNKNGNNKKESLIFNFNSEFSDITSGSFTAVSSGTFRVESDAPLFNKVPDLEVEVYNNYRLLKWSMNNIPEVSGFVIERSTDAGTFTELKRFEVSGRTENDYSFIDDSPKSSDVLYYRLKQLNKDGSISYSPLLKIGLGIVNKFILDQNFPNPFNPKTVITVDLLEDMDLEIIVYNLSGQEVRRVFKGFLTKGIHKFDFDGSDLPSGVYLYQVASGDFSETRKMILAK